MNILDRLYISAKLKAEKIKEGAQEFLSSQSGVSNIVATILILLIVVLLISFFWKQLTTWLKDVFGKIFSTPLPDAGDL